MPPLCLGHRLVTKTDPARWLLYRSACVASHGSQHALQGAACASADPDGLGGEGRRDQLKMDWFSGWSRRRQAMQMGAEITSDSEWTWEGLVAVAETLTSKFKPIAVNLPSRDQNVN